MPDGDDVTAKLSTTDTALKLFQSIVKSGSPGMTAALDAHTTSDTTSTTTDSFT